MQRKKKRPITLNEGDTLLWQYTLLWQFGEGNEKNNRYRVKYFVDIN